MTKFDWETATSYEQWKQENPMDWIKDKAYPTFDHFRESGERAMVLADEIRKDFLQQVEGLNRYANKIRSLTAPIYRLPNETLREIITMVLGEIKLPAHANRLLSVVGVSRQWRDIVSQMPQVWSSYTILQRRHAVKEDVLRTWLARSYRQLIVLNVNLDQCTAAMNEAFITHVNFWK